MLQRIAVYSFMTVSVVGLVAVLVFVMLGYQFNSDDGKIEQGGLVQFDSQPSGALVTIDGSPFGTRTASKTTMSAGPHVINMSRAGYNDWKKNVTVVPGSVLWLNYARLVPSDISPANVADFAVVTSAVASEDDKKMAIMQDAATPVFTIADLTRDDARQSTIALPDGSFTPPQEGKAQHFTIETWDPDSRYLLVRHTYDDSQIEWIVVDTDDVAATKNVTKLLNIQASNIVFSNGDSTKLYVQIDGDIRKVDLSAATLSRPLVSDVDSFSLYSDTMITFATRLSATGTRTVGYYIDGTDGPRIVRTFTDNGDMPLKFTVGRYFNETFEAIAYGDTVEVLIGDLPRDDKTPIALRSVAAMPVAGGAQYLSDKTNGRFIVAQNGPIYAVYDLELNKASTTTFQGTSPVTKRLQWLDDYTVWNDRDGMLRLYEFDGANQHDIMSIVPGMTATLSPSGKYLYGITQSEDGRYHLSRVQMIL